LEAPAVVSKNPVSQLELGGGRPTQQKSPVRGCFIKISAHAGER